MKNLALILLFITSLFGQVPVKIVDGNGVAVNVGSAGSSTTYAMQAVPNSSTALVSSTFKVQTIFCANITAGAVTLTITDNQGSPVTYVPAVSMAANSIFMINSVTGLTFTSGLKWSASASTSIYCQVEGVR
jgi:hypothetical protein